LQRFIPWHDVNIDDALDREIRQAAAFRRALRGFNARTEEAAAAAGLTPQRYDLLLAIHTGDGRRSTVTELVEKLHLQQTAVTELVKRAEDAGLLVREPSREDGRVSVLRLSPDGRRRFMRAFVALREDRNEMRAAFAEVGVRFRALER
jgi:DNA-binding MarR family transcriptional regulator